MRLEWPGFHLACEEGRLEFSWSGAGVLEMGVERCEAAMCRGSETGGGLQLVFRFRPVPDSAASPTVVRVDVPNQYEQSALSFVERLWHQHQVPDRPEPTVEDTGLERVPDDPEWFVAPVHPASEELFRDVMIRIADDGA
ncbi:hypothetical protein [Streptomyces lasiicapitis]|uniref:hypothetical protein n=1 Tax=Streptomyces lasiicapitis TaxID=1923961 RepID=UPI003663AF6B